MPAGKVTKCASTTKSASASLSQALSKAIRNRPHGHDINTYIFFLAPFFLKFLGFLPAVMVSSFVQILTERVTFLLIISY